MTADPQGEYGAVYAAYGMRVRSEVRLPSLPESTSHHVDLEIGWDAPCSVPRTAPPGRELLRHEIGDRLRYAAADDGDVYRLRFADCCDFVIDHDLRRVRCRPAPGTDVGLTVVLAEGALLAFVLAMAGRHVLHASALQVADGAVALTGSSGRGKSTVAAMLCAAGCPLVTDDMLRVDMTGDPLAFRGSTELRLRHGGAGVLGSFSTPVPTRLTADGRLALRPTAATMPLLPLRAIIVPHLDRGATAVELQRATTVEAFSWLLSFPRLLGWRAPSALRREFGAMSRLAADVPVMVARLPWIPPLPATAVEQLHEQLSTRHPSMAAPLS